MDLAGYRPSISEVAALFGKSSRWISELRAKGALPPDGATLKDYVAAWTSHHAAQVTGGTADSHKARLAAAKADQAEMKTAQMRGELLERPAVTSAVQGAFARVRARLLGIPSKAAPILVVLKSAVAVQEKLTELVHEALAELAATKVGLQEEGAESADCAAPGVEPGDGDGGERLVAGAGTPAEAAAEPVGGREPVPKQRGKRRTG